MPHTGLNCALWLPTRPPACPPLQCNGIMMVLYGRSLRHQSSLASTAATTAINISATGLLGRAVFGEATSLQWWAGASSIFLGSFLVSRAQKKAAGEAEAAPAVAAAAQPAATRKAAKAAAAPAAADEEEEGPARRAGARRRVRRD